MLDETGVGVFLKVLQSVFLYRWSSFESLVLYIIQTPSDLSIISLAAEFLMIFRHFFQILWSLLSWRNMNYCEIFAYFTRVYDYVSSDV